MSIFTNGVDQETIKIIHHTALEVLKSKGVHFASERARKVFSSHGFRTEGEIVYISESEVDRALSTCPSSFTLCGRDSQYDVKVGEGKPIFAPAYGPVFVHRHGQRKKGTAEDLLNFVKLVHSSEIIQVQTPYVISPCDVPSDDSAFYQQATCLRYSSKPTMTITAGGYNESKKAIQLTKEVVNRDEDAYVTIGLISSLSPLAFADNMTDSLIAFAEEGQPVILGCGALPGATSPASIAGTMITATAELLAGIVFAQLIRPGLPCVYGNMAAGTDLRFVTPAIGTPDMGKILAMSNALCRYYSIPCRGGGTVCDAKETDFEAGSEAMLSMFSTLAAGTDFIIHSVGILDSFNIVGYEKFILDEQIIEEVLWLLRDSSFDTDTMGLKAIEDVKHEGQYLMEPHTMDHMRNELYVPKVSLHGQYSNWINDGKESILDLANAALDSRIAGFEEPPIDEDAKAVLAPFLQL